MIEIAATSVMMMTIIGAKAKDRLLRLKIKNRLERRGYGKAAVTITVG